MISVLLKDSIYFNYLWSCANLRGRTSLTSTNYLSCWYSGLELRFYITLRGLRRDLLEGESDFYDLLEGDRYIFFDYSYFCLIELL